MSAPLGFPQRGLNLSRGGPRGPHPAGRLRFLPNQADRFRGGVPGGNQLQGPSVQGRQSCAVPEGNSQEMSVRDLLVPCQLPEIHDFRRGKRDVIEKEDMVRPRDNLEKEIRGFQGRLGPGGIARWFDDTRIKPLSLIGQVAQPAHSFW